MKNLLSEQDKKEIAEAIHQAECRTSGEIVFALSDASGQYRRACLEGALAGMVLAAFAYLAIPVDHTIGVLLWTQLVSFALAYVLLLKIPVRRWFIPSTEMEHRVQDAALMEFYARGLARTREANGVLIYLSVLERRVVVLGDRAIHERMGEGSWGEVRDTIIRGIREGRAGAGICEAVARCGDALAKYFPPRTDDINELPDEVVERKVSPGKE